MLVVVGNVAAVLGNFAFSALLEVECLVGFMAIGCLLFGKSVSPEGNPDAFPVPVFLIPASSFFSLLLFVFLSSETSEDVAEKPRHAQRVTRPPSDPSKPNRPIPIKTNRNE